jgi:hypothetical protein
MTGCGLITGEDRCIYFFGGKGKNGLKSSIYRFDFKTFSWEKVEANLEEAISFPESQLEDLGDNSYGHFNSEKRGLGIGDWGLGPIPNPQSPIPNPHILNVGKSNSLKFKITLA